MRMQKTIPALSIQNIKQTCEYYKNKLNATNIDLSLDIGFELPLHPVKTLIAYILAFYILFSTVVPCCVFDNCERKEHTEQTSNSDHKKDCNNCSPFSICSSASGFTLSSETTALEPVVFDGLPTYSEYYFSSKSEYYPSLFQPPRVG